MRHRLTSFLPLCLIIASSFLFFYKQIFLNRSFLASLVVNQGVTGAAPHGLEKTVIRQYPYLDAEAAAFTIEPATVLAGRLLRQWRMPLWNPYVAMGMPLAADMQAGYYFPLKILLYLNHKPAMWDFYFIVRILLAGFFAYLYCRLMKLGKGASLSGAFIFMYSGHFLLYIHIHHVDAEILIPLVLLCIERLVRRSDLGNALALGVAFGLILLGGCPPEVSFAIAFFATAYFLFRTLPRITLYQEFLASAGYFALAGFVGILISLPATAPFLELLRESYHGHRQAGLFHLMPTESILLFLPFFLDEHNFVLPYVGVLAPALALMAFGSKSNKSLVWFFWGFILFFMVRVFGLYGTNWIGQLPLFRWTLFPKYFFSSFLFSLSVCAAVGIEYVMSDQRKWRFIMIGLVSVPMFAIAFYVLHREPIMMLGKDAVAVRQVSTACAIIFLLAAVLILHSTLKIRGSFTIAILCLMVFSELFFYAYPLDYPRRTDPFPQAPYIQHLRQDHSLFRIFSLQGVLPPNYSTVVGLSDIGVNNAIFIRRYIKFMQEAINPACGPGKPVNEGGPNISSRLLDLLNVKYLISKTHLPLPADRFRIVYNREVKIYRNLRCMPRAFLVYQWEVIPEESQVLSRMLSGQFDFRNHAILEEQPAAVDPDDPQLLLSTDSSPEVLRYTADEVMIRVSPIKDGVLVLTDSFFRGWRAEVDGREAKVLRADYLFRGIYLEPGEHVVRFRYSPLSTWISCVISMITMAGIAIWAAWKLANHWGRNV